MNAKIYPINRAVGKPVEFRGLQGQYIFYLAAGLVSLLLLLALLFVVGLPHYPSLAAVLLAGGYLFHWVYRMNKRYGEYGRMKKRAAARIPTVIRSISRNAFILPDNINH